MTSNIEVIHAYRHLYRSFLRAVQYARPNRFIGRDRIRSAFREKDVVFDARGIQRTIWFFNGAAKERGLEHTVLKNLLQVQSRRRPGGKKGWIVVHAQSKNRNAFEEYKSGAFEHYEMTVAMLNKSMGTLLR